MSTAAELRKQVEAALEGRFPSALSVRPAAVPELLSCGIAELDAALGGGLPLGGITELTGPASSGRTTLILATLAEITRQGGTCAYVDMANSFDPVSAAALGTDLQRLLWVRMTETSSAAKKDSVDTATSALPPIQGQAKKSTLDDKRHRGGHGWRHPRDQIFGMDCSVGELFQEPSQRLNPHLEADPGYSAQRPVEDLSDFTPRCSESIRRKRPKPIIFTARPVLSHQLVTPARYRSSPAKPWSRLDQALRATDLLLNAGGFRAVVLDIGDVRPEHARRVPLATWYRFRLQVEKSQTLFLLLTLAPCANSCAAVSLQFEGVKANWQQAAESSPPVLTGLRYSVNIVRNRASNVYHKKPAASAQALWSSATAWSG
jgi:recombination protein RecA